MKRMLAAVLALLVCFGCAAAEENSEFSPTEFETYAQAVEELTEEVWEADVIELIQRIEPEDGVTMLAVTYVVGLEDSLYAVMLEVVPG